MTVIIAVLLEPDWPFKDYMTMRNDPFAIPRPALDRPRGHDLKASNPKMSFLYRPLAATGVPLGGIGTGGITRSSDGRFSRWTIKGGGIKAFAMPANGFVLRVARADTIPVARSLQPKPDTGELGSFTYEDTSPEWGGLFPFAWHHHAPLDGIECECLSFSPVIAEDIECSSLPVAVFRWRLRNIHPGTADVSLAFHFANLNGWFHDFDENRPSRVAAGCFNRCMDIDNGAGVILDRRRTGDLPCEGNGQWAIAISCSEPAEYSRTICFDGCGDGSELWDPLLATGDAPELGDGWLSEGGFRETPPGHPTAAVCTRSRIGTGEEVQLTAVLVWDLPGITFGQGRKWFRGYTRDWGRKGNNGQEMAIHALDSATSWEHRISEWHGKIREELGSEPHRAGVAINESYFLVDGLTLYAETDEGPTPGLHFGLIECHDYALYNTLDLWIYAAEAVARFYPELAACVASDYARHLQPADIDLRRHRWDNSLFPINLANACPHDLGGPGEDPFFTANSYTYRDSTLWKDLNCDLVLCIFREGKAMGSEWRRNLFPAVRAAIDHLQGFDRDGDGLIENDGIPDQTFDNIPMKGASSYCGGLWIATLLAGAILADEIGEDRLARTWRQQAERASSAFEDLLFNGNWFRVDTEGPLSGACFIEQMFGPFLARRLGLGNIVEEKVARIALRSIFENNFKDAGGGEGAVSLSKIPREALAYLPHQDDTSFQTAEIQPGFNYSLAAQLEEWGLDSEADELRKSLYQEMYVKRNLVFQTPAAYDRNRMTCRAVLNMRPLAAWWMAHSE